MLMPATYKGLELQRLGVSKDFVCIGRWACQRHPYIESRYRLSDNASNDGNDGNANVGKQVANALVMQVMLM